MIGDFGVEKMTGEERFFALSFGELGLRYQYELAPKAYNNPFGIRIRSELDVDLLSKVFEKILERHEILRATYAFQDGLPIRLHHGNFKFSVDQIDASKWSDDYLSEQIQIECRAKFDLDKLPLVRAKLFFHGPSDFTLLINTPHLISDGPSYGILINELLKLYALGRTGMALEVPKPKSTYDDYVRWQKKMLEGPEGERIWKFWENKLAGELPVLSLPQDKEKPTGPSDSGARLLFDLDSKTAEALGNFAKLEGVSQYSVFLTAFSICLHGFSGQEDIIIGASMTGEGRARFRSTMGYMVNMVPIRLNLAGNPTFRQLCQRTQESFLEAAEFQESCRWRSWFSDSSQKFARTLLPYSKSPTPIKTWNLS